MVVGKILAVVVAVVVLYSEQATAQGGTIEEMACMEKLMPCQPYIHMVDLPPPPSCCEPVKEVVQQAACLCTVVNNPSILGLLDLSKQNALDLLKQCGVNPNVSVCSPPPTGSPGSSKGSSSTPIISLGGFSFLTALVAIVIILF